MSGSDPQHGESVRTADVVIPAFNSEDVVGNTLCAVQRQTLPAGWVCRVVVVDDGSTDGTAQVVRDFAEAQTTLAHAPRRLGRAGARNFGMRAGTGSCVVFLDADCAPTTDAWLDRHIRTLEAGFDLSFGKVISEGQGFWQRYHEIVEQRRAQQLCHGEWSAITSQNLAVRRTAVEKVGGFPVEYRAYGFEDRALVQRLLESGAAMAYCEQAAVVHWVGGTVAAYCAKMNEAGRYSAPLFRRRFPEIYARLPFSWWDASPDGRLPRLAARTMAD